MEPFRCLDEAESEVVKTVRRFVERDVRPVVRGLEHANEYPAGLIDRMKQLGVYGLLVPGEFGGLDTSMECFTLVTEELSRGWMSLAGAMGGHSVVVYLLRVFGTAEQQARYLPGMATGELRATMALTEPGGGSDLQAMRTVAVADGDELVVDGAKTWISNARRAGLMAVLCKTDPSAQPRHRGVSIVMIEPAHGYSVSADLGKLGYRGIEACEVVFDSIRVPTSQILGGVAGVGFRQMMRGLEVGRIQVAARALGVGRAAFDDAMRYAQQREAFGKPIYRHQAIGHMLAEMATDLQAARLLTLDAARAVDEGRRADLEASMAKLFASEAAMRIALDAMRIHGGYGYSTEFDVERYFRDAPLMIIGEGTNEVLKNIIMRRLVHHRDGE